MRRMIRYISILVGAVASALFVRERRIRRGVERLGAATLETLLDTIEANNAETGEHVRRVATYALILGEAADLEPHQCRSVERVALFHDIGKIDGAITDIIKDTDRLTPGERKAVRTHPRRGAEVLQPIASFYPDLVDGVLSHHERWDGSGYPRGLRGKRIPITARVVAIADTFDAVTHSRSYSRGMSVVTATKVIAAGRGTQFDPDLVDLFLSPPVLDRIAEAMRSVYGPRRAKGKRGRTSPRDGVPDITFRWRTPSLGRQSADR